MRWVLKNKLAVALALIAVIACSGCLNTTVDIDECNNIPNGTGKNICLQNYWIAQYRDSGAIDPSYAAVCDTFVVGNDYYTDKYKCYYVFALEAARAGKASHAREFCQKISLWYAESILDDPVMIRNMCFTDAGIIMKDLSMCNYLEDRNTDYFGVLHVFSQGELQSICRERVNQKINERLPFS